MFFQLACKQWLSVQYLKQKDQTFYSLLNDNPRYALGLQGKNIIVIVVFCYLDIFVRTYFRIWSRFQCLFVEISLNLHVCHVSATSIGYLLNQRFKDYYWYLIGTTFYHSFHYLQWLTIFLNGCGFFSG